MIALDIFQSVWYLQDSKSGSWKLVKHRSDTRPSRALLTTNYSTTSTTTVLVLHYSTSVSSSSNKYPALFHI